MKILTLFKKAAEAIARNFNAPLDNEGAAGPGPRPDYKKLHDMLTNEQK